MFRLIQDQDCHWYLIPSDKVEEFNLWTDGIDIYNLPDFDSMRINGPHQILIKDYELA